MSETFQPPNDEVSEKLYASARKFFEKWLIWKGRRNEKEKVLFRSGNSQNDPQRKKTSSNS